jgi:hypothetical protein
MSEGRSVCVSQLGHVNGVGKASGGEPQVKEHGVLRAWYTSPMPGQERLSVRSLVSCQLGRASPSASVYRDKQGQGGSTLSS